MYKSTCNMGFGGAQSLLLFQKLYSWFCLCRVMMFWPGHGYSRRATKPSCWGHNKNLPCKGYMYFCIWLVCLSLHCFIISIIAYVVCAFPANFYICFPDCLLVNCVHSCLFSRAVSNWMLFLLQVLCWVTLVYVVGCHHLVIISWTTRL